MTGNPGGICPTCGQPVRGIEERIRAELARALDETGQTQKWLADQVGITQKHMSQMLTGRASINLNLADQMFAVLGRSVAIGVLAVDVAEEG